MFAGISLASVLALLATRHWFFELFTHFRPYYLLFQALLVPGADPVHHLTCRQHVAVVLAGVLAATWLPGAPLHGDDGRFPRWVAAIVPLLFLATAATMAAMPRATP